LSWEVLRDQLELSSGGAEFVFFFSIQFIIWSGAEAGHGNKAEPASNNSRRRWRVAVTPLA